MESNIPYILILLFRYYYKPDNKKSCCQLNTIRLEAEKYKPNKKQRKIMNRFNRYLLGTYVPNKEEGWLKIPISIEKNMEVEQQKSKEESKTEEILLILNEKLKESLKRKEDFLISKGIDMKNIDFDKVSFIQPKIKKKNKAKGMESFV